MAVQLILSGSVTNADLQQLRIDRASDGSLVGSVVYSVQTPFGTISRTASWTLSAQDQTNATALIPSAKAAIQADLGA